MKTPMDGLVQSYKKRRELNVIGSYDNDVWRKRHSSVKTGS